VLTDTKHKQLHKTRKMVLLQKIHKKDTIEKGEIYQKS